MKTLEQLKEWKAEAMDGRDENRLIDFIPENMLKEFDIELKDEYKGKHKSIKLTRSNVMRRLKSDLEFAFEKALNKRGLSSSSMFYVISMWNWILEDGLENYGDDDKDYAQYGLPLYKATALKYSLPNPIGEDKGNEYHYSDKL